MDDFLKVPEVAKILRVCTKTVYEAVRAKEIPGVLWVKGNLRFNKAVFLEWSKGEKAA